MYRKVAAVWVSLLIMVSSIVVLVEIADRVEAPTTLYVGGGGPGNYSKIQDAIDVASDGDTVFVYKGTYYENVLVSTSITFLGEKGETFINGSGIGTIIKINATNVVIDGFVIQSSGYNDNKDYYYEYDSGIEVNSTDFIRISNCTFEDIPKVGILYFGEVSNSIVENCSFYYIDMNAIRWDSKGVLGIL